MQSGMVLLSFLLMSPTLSAGRSDKPPGTVICHYSQQDSIYVGSPSLCILPDGTYIASHDEFGPGSSFTTSATTRVYRSEDRGKFWSPIARLDGQFWSNLFLHRGTLYLMGTDREQGNLIIRRSEDGGNTWSTPTDSIAGLLRTGEYHTAPMPVISYRGRVWRAVECARSNTEIWGKRYSAMIISAPDSADLLKAASWTVTDSLPYDSTYLNGQFGGWLEGNAVITPEGNVADLLRVDYAPGPEYAALIRLRDTASFAPFNPEKDFVRMPGGAKKFTVRYDSLSGRYWALVNCVTQKWVGKENPAWVRNSLALASSPDLREWTVHRIVLHHPDRAKHGFQYADWLFDGDDIVCLSRTAYDDNGAGAHNCHDANYMTFHRIKDFRKALTEQAGNR